MTMGNSAFHLFFARLRIIGYPILGQEAVWTVYSAALSARRKLHRVAPPPQLTGHAKRSMTRMRLTTLAYGPADMHSARGLDRLEISFARRSCHITCCALAVIDWHKYLKVSKKTTLPIETSSAVRLLLPTVLPSDGCLSIIGDRSFKAAGMVLGVVGGGVLTCSHVRKSLGLSHA
jgi:hypothetical protein